MKLLLRATEGPGLEDCGTRDFEPVNGFRDLVNWWNGGLVEWWNGEIL